MAERNKLQRIGTSIEHAVEILRKGGVVAIPTETYYGLAVDPNNSSAVEKIYRMKRRQRDKALLLLIDNIDQLSMVAQDIPPLYSALMVKYWPGPLTLVFHARAELNRLITGADNTVGVRISPHPTATTLVQKMGAPVTATSANVSGFPPARTSQEVDAIFDDQVDYILDGGICDGGMCSTIVGIEKEKLVIYRKGLVDIGEAI